MANKKAVSDIVTTILIILLALAAIVIVWAAVKKTVETGSEQMGSEKFSVGLSSKRTILSPVLSKVSVTRNAGQGEITGIKIIFKNATTSWTYENRLEIPKELETIEYLVDLTGNISDVLSYEVYPIIKQGAQETPGVKATIQPDVNGTGGCDAYCQLENAAVSYWKFEGNANDEKGMNNGAINGNVDCSVAGSGRKGIGRGCSFDGYGDYVNVVDTGTALDFDNNQNYTWSAWINYKTFPENQQCYISKDAPSTIKAEGFNLCLTNSNGGDFVVCRGTGYLSNINCSSNGVNINSANTWAHLAVVYSGNSIWQIYKNNAYIGAIDWAVLSDTSADYYIGAGNAPASFGAQFPGLFFNGTIDEVMIFNKSLAASEVQAIYDAQK